MIELDIRGLLASAIAWRLSTSAFLNASAFASSIFLARCLEPGQVGSARILTSMMALLSVVQGIGVGRAASLAAAHELGFSGRRRALLPVQLSLAAGCSLILLAVGLNAGTWLKDGSLAAPICLMIALPWLFAWAPLYNGWLGGRMRFSEQARVAAAAKAGAVAVLGAALALGAGLFSVVLAQGADFTLQYLLARRFAGELSDGRGAPERAPSGAAFAAWETLSRSIVILMPLSGLAVLKTLSPRPEICDFYAVSLALTKIPEALTAAVCFSLFPVVAKEAGAGNPDRARGALAWSLSRWALAVLPACAVIWAVCGKLIPLLYGARFLPSVSDAAPLLAAACLAGLFQIVTTGTSAFGEPEVAGKAASAALAASILTSVLWVPSMGASGAAAAQVAGWLVGCAGLGLSLYRRPSAWTAAWTWPAKGADLAS